MQAKNHMKKLIKFSSKLLRGELEKPVKLDCITIRKILRCFSTNGYRKWRNRLRNKICCLGRIFWTKDKLQQMQKKIAKRENFLHGGISPIYLSLSNKWKPCHRAINSRTRNFRTAQEKYFQFQWSCKQLRIEVRKSITNFEILFLSFL